MHFCPREYPGMKPPGFRYSLYNALVVPRPIGWISTVSADGVVNLAPFSFSNMVAGDPPAFMYCANGAHREGGPKDSLANVGEVPEFVFNLCSYALREQMNATSATSPRSVDEMAAAGLKAAPAVRVRPPRVAASPIALECEVFQVVPLPSSEATLNTMVIGRVVEVHIDDSVVVDGVVDVRRIRPLARLGYQDYAAIDDPFPLIRPD
jgi:flavin reductase (DIM6/NTAB) family NADH-FMN oxidoreductase RutF